MIMKRILLIVAILATAFAVARFANSQTASVFSNQASEVTASTAVVPAAAKSGLAVATFAGGCFWCIESTFEKLDGVSEAVSGYSGGQTENPTYYEVSKGNTGHTETVQIYYDPEVISYEELLFRFWRDIDPTDSKGQFVDRGDHYRPAIFYHDEQEKQLALASIEALDQSKRFNEPVTVEVVPFDKFYKAESYHQNYHVTNSLRYKLYRKGSGRDRFLEKVWGDDLYAKFEKSLDIPDSGSADDMNQSNSETASEMTSETASEMPLEMAYVKPDDDTLQQTLTPLQYQVTQHEATEPPFRNEYWDNKAEGIYVDIVTGEPLFSSTTKYRSGTGWPSFWEPIDDHFIVTTTDYKLFYPRTEIKSKYGGSHLGHVFKDGPAPTGLRYCINSASLKFVEKSRMEEQGYTQYLALFEQ